MRSMAGISRGGALAAVVLAVALAGVARAQEGFGKGDPDGITQESMKSTWPEYFRPIGNDRVRPAAIPDVFGPGAVLTVGNIFMKVTNLGTLGNPFTAVSSDPGGQWPGASAVEYLSSIRLAIAAVNPTATDPNAIRRVSYFQEWRPPTLDLEDRMYRAYDGIINGGRFVNDDGDLTDDYTLGKIGLVDEDFLDGRDNDGDKKIDEDHAAIGQQEYSCVIRDDTDQAKNSTFNEKHIPLGLEVKQLAWAYSIAGFQDFNVCQYTITNINGYTLDSLYVGFLVDMDAGPLAKASNYFLDDLDLPGFPSGEFTIDVPATDTRRQAPHDPTLDATVGPGPLCSKLKLRVNGFSIGDDDGDDNKTTGIPSVLLFNYTTDPLGVSAPSRVEFRAYRSFVGGTPYTQNGNPVIDQQRYEFMAGQSQAAINGYENVDPVTGFINAELGDQKGDYIAWCSTGPWRNIPAGGHVEVTIGFAVKTGTYNKSIRYRQDYESYISAPDNQKASKQLALLQTYPALDNAVAAQIAYEGVWEARDGPANAFPDFHGRETGVRLPRGSAVQFLTESCDGREERTVQVTDREFTWFDFDCDYCTGVWDYSTRRGLFHKTWNAEAPPPSPNANVGVKYNYTDNPDRTATPAGDKEITIAWDNLSEVTADPKSGWFDARGYRIWKVANWTRPVGSPGPGEDDWSLIGEYRLFEYRVPAGGFVQQNFTVTGTDTVCPMLYIPNWKDPTTGRVGPADVPICLQRGDLWDRQTGDIIHPAAIGCARDPDFPRFPGDTDSCAKGTGCLVGTSPCVPQVRLKYPVGRYRYVDREVKNGFLYFYSVTAFDSTGDPAGGSKSELGGRRSAVEAEGTSPQASTSKGKNVWVVPNPYRGTARLQDRPSAWDLTPNASDPTGTHIDFMGLPAGGWTIRIYTVSGDLVQIIHATDAVNESVRAPVTDDAGTTRPGYVRQQDYASDGQASWNLISRNGQDVVSGIYIFTVESREGTQRGKFVVIR